MDHFTECYVCKSSLIKKFYINSSLSKCLKCKFVFYDQLPLENELNAIYSGYSRDSYITDASHNKVTSTLREITNSHNISSVLDIACGECYHLDALQEIDSNLELYATEHASAKKNVISKGYHFIDGEFYPDTDNRFDLIIFTEAIEHINDPIEFLNHAYKLLNPNGLLYMTTPCFSSLERVLMGESWGMIAPPEHLSYFNKASIDKALKISGFTKVYSRSLNISLFRIVEFLNRSKKIVEPIKSEESKKINKAQIASDKVQNIIKGNIILRYLKTFLNIILNIVGWGSSLQVLYKKKLN